MKTTSGSITTQNLNPTGTATAGSAVQLVNITDESATLIQVTGTYTGALTLQGMGNGADWVDLSGLTDLSTGTTVSTIASGSVGLFRADCSGLDGIRVSANGAVTGQANIVLRAGAVTPAVTDVSVSLEASDIQIGAVEIKDATTDNRQIVAADGRAATDANLQVGDADAPGGAGVVTASTPRVVLATDVPLPAGTNQLGGVDPKVFQRDTNTFAIAVSDVASTAITFTGGTGTRVRVANAGANPVAFRLDATAPVFPTVGTDQPVYVVLPGSVEVFEAGAAGVSLRAICATGLTSTLYVCMGTGV